MDMTRECKGRWRYSGGGGGGGGEGSQIFFRGGGGGVTKCYYGKIRTVNPELLQLTLFI